MGQEKKFSIELNSLSGEGSSKLRMSVSCEEGVGACINRREE